MKCWTEIGNNLRPHHCAHLLRYQQNLVPLFNLQLLQFLGQHLQQLLAVLVHGLPLLICPRTPIYSSLASASHAPRAIFSPAPCIFCHWRAALLPDGCRHVCSLLSCYLASSLSSSSCSASRGITLLMFWSSKYLLSLADSSTLPTV